MNPIETPSHLASAALIFTIGFFIALKITKKLKLPVKITIILYFWHTIFAVVYMYFTIIVGGDSIYYYEAAKTGNIDFSFGTSFVEHLSHIIVHYFNLSYLGLFLFFSVVTYYSILIIYASIYTMTRSCPQWTKHLLILIIFLPSMHFWPSAISKDAFSFLSASLALWAALNLPRRKVLMAIAIIIMLLVRPHMAGIMIMALGTSLLIGAKQISLVKRVAIASIVFPVAIILVPFAANYAGIENITDITEINEYIDQRQGYNMEGGGGIDISGMSLPMQIFTYLFRPLPYEAHSIFAFFSSLDNLILLLLFLYAIRFVCKKSNTPANHVFLWLYVIISILVLSMTTANLGISVRQKWMFMPILIYLLFAGIATHQKQKQRKKIARMEAARFSTT